MIMWPMTLSYRCNAKSSAMKFAPIGEVPRRKIAERRSVYMILTVYIYLLIKIKDGTKGICLIIK